MSFFFGSRSNKTFKPKKNIPEGTHQYDLMKHAAATLGSGNLRLAVKLPEGEDLNEWVAVNTVDFFNQINMLYGTITEFCTEDSCPLMSAGPRYEYHWADYTTVKKPIKCSAPKYIDYLMTWAQDQLDDETIFPSKIGVPFPRNFITIAKTILKRLFRVYAHIYHQHFDQVVQLGEEAHLNTSFKHFIYFVQEFALIVNDQLAPLAELIDKLTSKDSEGTSRPRSPSPKERKVSSPSNSGHQQQQHQSSTSSSPSSPSSPNSNNNYYQDGMFLSHHHPPHPPPPHPAALALHHHNTPPPPPLPPPYRQPQQQQQQQPPPPPPPLPQPKYHHLSPAQQVYHQQQQQHQHQQQQRAAISYIMQQQHQTAPQNFDFSRPQPPIPQQPQSAMNVHQQNARQLPQTNYDNYHQQQQQLQQQQQQQQQLQQQQLQQQQQPLRHQYVPRFPQQQQPRPEGYYLPTIHNRSPLMVPPPPAYHQHLQQQAQQQQQQQQQTQQQHAGTMYRNLNDFANLGGR